jgi:dolichol-phosphate mannosyltransferase
MACREPELKTIAVIPTYNEVQNLPELVRQLFCLDIAGLEVLIVDDNSPDGTGEVADNLAQKYPQRLEVIHREGKMGLATAYTTGFARALERGADFIVEMDADFSHSPQYIRDFLARMDDCDVLVGSRYAPGSMLDPRWGLWRRLVSGLGNRYLQLVTGLKVRDASGGFKCFRREALEGLDLGKVRSRGYIFQVEMTYLCHKMGYMVAELPILFSERAQGKSKMSLGIIGEAIWRPWHIKWCHRGLKTAGRSSKLRPER